MNKTISPATSDDHPFFPTLIRHASTPPPALSHATDRRASRCTIAELRCEPATARAMVGPRRLTIHTTATSNIIAFHFLHHYIRSTSAVHAPHHPVRHLSTSPVREEREGESARKEDRQSAVSHTPQRTRQWPRRRMPPPHDDQHVPECASAFTSLVVSRIPVQTRPPLAARRPLSARDCWL